MYKIYLAVNQINEKMYVGFTGDSLHRRFYFHRSDARKGSRQHFHSAIRKYGIERFSIDVIATSETRSDAGQKEMFWIKYFQSNVRGVGYNMTGGGDGVRDPSEEARAKLSRVHSGKIISPEHRAALSKRFSGEGNPSYGKRHTEEAKKKIGEASSKRRHTGETKKKMSASRKGEKHHMFGKKQSPEIIAKMNAAKEGKGHTDETKHKISLATRGENNPNYGKTHSPETRARISAARKAGHAQRKEAAKRENALTSYSDTEQTSGPRASPLGEDSSWLSSRTSFVPEASEGEGLLSQMGLTDRTPEDIPSQEA